jgi:peptidoglycan biosynthesis protein MviN/MurJ (putative lipid II flippase)
VTVSAPSGEDQSLDEAAVAPSPSDDQGLLAANISVALGTLFSRLTGLLRVIVFGIVIGQNALADAYDGANNSPNSIYELLLGGVLSATLVPLFTEHIERDDDEATDAVVSVSVIFLATVTAADLPSFLDLAFPGRQRR